MKIKIIRILRLRECYKVEKKYNKIDINDGNDNKMHLYFLIKFFVKIYMNTKIYNDCLLFIIKLK